MLGAGGTLGHAYHAGTLAALVEATGWEPRTAGLVVGTSAGSAAAAALRGGFSAADLAARQSGRPLSVEGRRLASRLASPLGAPLDMATPPVSSPRWMASAELLRRALLRPGSVGLGAALAAMLPPGQTSAGVIGAGVRALHGEGWPHRPTWICAVSLESGKRVVFGRSGAPRASLADAVAASCAIPAVFQPVTIEGRRYVDGGVHSGTNLDCVAGLDLELVIVSAPMAGRPEAILGSLGMPLRAAAAARLAREVREVQRQGPRVVVFQPNRADVDAMGLNLMESGRRRRVVEQARASARDWLERPSNRSRLAAILG